MKLHQTFSLKIVAFCLALVFITAPTLLPVTAVAAGGGQIDACGSSDPTNPCNKFIGSYLNPTIQVLSALVGIVAVLSIIIAGIQYSASADDPGTVTKAKQRIFNVIIGLVAYVFLLAFLRWLVPGAVF